VGRTLRTVREEFAAMAGLEGLEAIRSHSGRRRQVTKMVRKGVDEAAAMAFSLHTGRAVFTCYPQLTPQDRVIVS